MTRTFRHDCSPDAGDCLEASGTPEANRTSEAGCRLTRSIIKYSLMSMLLMALGVLIPVSAEPRSLAESTGVERVPVRIAATDDPIAQLHLLSEASLLLANQADKDAPLLSLAPDRPMVPASTMKLLVALAALDRWGPDHRFTTALFLDAEDRLWVRGGGDPTLVSEELDRLARALKQAGIDSIEGLGLDDSLFVGGDRLPGRSETNNPYDAPITALAVNFNTAALRIQEGAVSSGEPQTPLTAMARRQAYGLPAGRHRVNLRGQEQSLLHFGEVLAVKLKQAGIQVRGGIRLAPVPRNARPVLVYQNSRDLRAVIADMLEFSNNFIANSLFLSLGLDANPAQRSDLRSDLGTAQQQMRSATLARAQRTMRDWAQQRFGWEAFEIKEGAGLSRGNRLSARQLLDVLEAFEPYRDLVAIQDGNPKVRAKTGTLNGVSSYAGWVLRDGNWTPFSLIINQSVPFGFRLRVASALAESSTRIPKNPGN